MSKTWGTWILGDQLSHAHPRLQSSPAQAGPVIFVESQQLLRRLPYHRKKLVLLLSAMRHFAQSLRERGFEVYYTQAPTMGAGLRQAVEHLGLAGLHTMQASSFFGARWQRDRASRAAGVPVVVQANTLFLAEQLGFPPPKGATRLETFYRQVRKKLDVLMQADGEPEGGVWNLDTENRKPLPARVQPPEPRRFEPDALTQACIDEVATWAHAWGDLEGFGYAVTASQAWEAFEDFVEWRLPGFGPYEDAMTVRSDVVYHALLSPYMNLGLLDSMAMVRRVEACYHAGEAPLQSVEGFVRQVIGWREFMYWRYQHAMPELAQANHWRATRPVPEFFWTGDTPMACLRYALGRTRSLGYNHHIERLMLFGNYFVLAGVDPRLATAWYSAAYVDAYDWVMQSNAMGMGLNADGGKISSKPYIASAAYINKMSDYCKGCRYDPKQRTGPDACPFNGLYWNFLIEHEDELRRNPRMGPAVLGLRHLDASDRVAVQQQAQAHFQSLSPSKNEA